MTAQQPPPIESLEAAWQTVERADQALARWNAREPQPYVKHGHQAIELIDQALAELHAARATLTTEIRLDRDKRDAETDALLARLQAERSTVHEAPDRNGAAPR